MESAPAANRVSIIDALGFRRVSAAVPALAGQLRSTEPAAAAVAIDALGRIASPDALASLRDFAAPPSPAAGATRSSSLSSNLRSRIVLVKYGEPTQGSSFFDRSGMFTNARFSD
jgi:HEAT repeat protein